MNTFPKALRFDDQTMWVDFEGSRSLSVPLNWFPRLLNATPAQREAYEISELGQGGLHWDELDEDISVGGLLAGRGDMTRKSPAAA